MLTEIHVENVALIEEAVLELEPGLNAITGETGAGKTLLATALQLLLGGRARSETVRAGAKRATVEGSFVLPDELRGEVLRETLGDVAEEIDAEDALILRRTLTEDGRSRCYVGGVSVPVRSLAALGERLVSYHGQREQARLTDPAEQLAILDDFLDSTALRAREERRQLWTSVERDRREREAMTTSSEVRLRELDFLRFQVDEIETSNYSKGEMEDLGRERDRLRNVTDLVEASAAASADLSSEDGGAIDAVARAASELERATRHDASVSPLTQRLSSLHAELTDVLYELRSYLDDLEADPGRLDVVEDRLASLRALERKYGDDVEGFLGTARASLTRLENLDEETAGLGDRITAGERQLEELAQTITRGRERASRLLCTKVQENLADLNLGATTFVAELIPTAPGPSGVERVEFEIQPNPGEPRLPVRRYASGGELSRIMLAIRLAQERIQPGATYIFDEVDAGIGGETATAVGAKLRQLGDRNQVLTITHLPQIASEASSHVVVAKRETKGRTITDITRVEGDERRRELARMLSGRVDDASLAHASELLLKN